MKQATLVVWAALALAGVAQARDLVQVYDDAVLFDPAIHVADATRMGAREAAPQALAALLPQINGNYATSRTRSESDSVEQFPSTADPSVLVSVPASVSGYTDQHGYNLQLQQTV